MVRQWTHLQACSACVPGTLALLHVLSGPVQACIRDPPGFRACGQAGGRACARFCLVWGIYIFMFQTTEPSMLQTKHRALIKVLHSKTRHQALTQA